jgi:hypothetical protein
MRAYVLGEFEREHALLDAARALRARGSAGTRLVRDGASYAESGFAAEIHDLDLHSPYPLHGSDEALGLRRSTVPLVTLVAGVTGAVTGYLLQWYVNAYAWALNVGNRPPHSPPAFIPVTFELGVLFAALSIFGGLLFVYFRFPRVHHPVFEVEAFRSASIDGLWLSAGVDAAHAESLAQELRRLGARQVSIVPEARR